MNHTGIRLIIAILALSGTIEWNAQTRHGETTIAVAQPSESCQEIGRISNGEGLLLRNGISSPIVAGERLCVGDRVQATNAGTSAECTTDGTTRRFPQGMASPATSVCPPVEECDPDGCIRGDDDRIFDPNIPHILSPRNTALLTTQPPLRWGAFPGASRYTVTVEQGGETVWGPIEVEGTEIAYSGNPLAAGSSYKLTVTADNGAASSRFSLLNEAKQAEVKQVLAMQPIDATAVIPPLVYIYIHHSLFSEAIEMVETAIGNGNRSAAIYLQLGQLYNDVSLSFKAEQAYLEAIELATSEGNLKGQALARARLGQLYLNSGNVAAAIEQLSQATMLYEQAGDPDRAAAVEKIRQEVQP